MNSLLVPQAKLQDMYSLEPHNNLAIDWPTKYHSINQKAILMLFPYRG